MDAFWLNFLQNLLLAMVPVLAASLAGFLIVQARAVWARIQAEKPDIADELPWMARTAVKAAEMAGAKDYALDKLDYAVGVVQDLLDAKGFGAVKVDLIVAAVEAAVLDVIKDQKLEIVKNADGHLVTERSVSAGG